MPTDNPDPWLICVALDPASQHDRDRLNAALGNLLAEDPALSFVTDMENGEPRLCGMGEEQLDAAVGRLIGEFGIAMRVGAPEIRYLETISRRAEVSYTHKRRKCDEPEFARLDLIASPGAADAGDCEISWRAPDGLPEDCIAAAEAGLRSALAAGPIGGFPVIGTRVEVTGANPLATAPSPLAFEVAARAALRDALRRAGPRLLEPVMRVEVTVPQACAGPVIGDLASRRGMMHDQETSGEDVGIRASVGLARMFGYRSALRAMTDGRGNYTLVFSHYQAVPTGNDDPGDPDNFPPAVGLRAAG